MATFGPSFPRRRRPSSPTKSPRFYHPTPNFPNNSTLLPHHNVKQVPNRSASRTPRPMTPQENFYSSYVLQQNPLPGSSPRMAPIQIQMPRTPQIRPFSPAPSSGVSSVKSLSDSESDSDTEMIMMRPSLQIFMQEPETSEDESDAEVREIHDEKPNLERESSITIEELPASLVSPMYTPPLKQGEVWTDESGLLSIDIEVLKGDYSSALSDDDTEAATTTDFRTDASDDDDDTFNEWSIDICSSSYPTDAFLLGGFSSLSTGISGSAFPQTKGGPSPGNTGTYGRSEMRKSQPGISPRSTMASRKRSYTWTEDTDSDGDDESDGDSKKSPRKRARRRMTIESVLDGFAEAEAATATVTAERNNFSLRRKTTAVKKRRPLSFHGIEGVFHSSAEMDLDN